MRIGYSPYSLGLTEPGDRRRFPRYAAIKGLEFDVVKSVSKDYDLVILSSKADIVAWSSLPRGGPKLVYELIDSQLALPKGDYKWKLLGTAKALTREIARPVFNYRNAIEAMCNRADAIVCGSPEQKVELEAFNGNVHDILDFNEEIGGEPKSDYEMRRRPVLVWEGLSYSVGHLRLLGAVLDELNAALDVRIITDPFVPRIGAHYFRMPTDRVLRQTFANCDLRPWEKQSMPALVTECDIAVIPIDLSDPVARSKPENKLMLLWRLGMPVVTSGTPAYRRCMQAAGLDNACDSTGDWARALRNLLADRTARLSAGVVGREYVERYCGTPALVQRWDHLLASVMGAVA
ncbi:MAG: hypothetical protein ABSA91_16150 [Acidimicrobiales bacterium]|jgi:hypothetical protein